MGYDTQLGRDVLIEPNVFFGPGVTVEDNAEIRANCYMEQAVYRQGRDRGAVCPAAARRTTSEPA